MEDDRLDNLKRLVQKRPVVLFRFEGEKWSSLRESRRGANEFTIARSHELFEKVRVPIACLIIGKDGGRSEVFLGVASSRSAVTTLESRIKVKRALHIQPSSKAGIVADNRFVPATRGSHSLGDDFNGVRRRPPVDTASPFEGKTPSTIGACNTANLPHKLKTKMGQTLA